MILTRLILYASDDSEFSGDYESVEILDPRGVVIAKFGDWYHDKGFEKSEGFIEGVKWTLGNKKLTIVENKMTSNTGYFD